VITPDIAVVGGGLFGRCLAWRASREGARIVLLDSGGSGGEHSAAWVAAGMISPATEAIEADPQVISMGDRSLELWPQWLAQLPIAVFYRDAGTVLVWHREHAQEAARTQKIISLRVARSRLKCLDGSQLVEVEPELGTHFSQALYVRGEAWIDNRGLLKAVGLALDEEGVECHWETPIKNGDFPAAGIVVDCRGMGAKDDLRELRGVRGEIVRLHAPEIELNHMLRLLHPRYPVYIAPRPEGRLVVGATSIESEDRSPASVRGVLELLMSAYSMIPALAEARILEFNTQVRPALPDNLPALRFDRERKILHINGFYRHGFLLTPTVVEEALNLLFARSSGRWPCLDVNCSADIPGSLDRAREVQTCHSS
jgi:glycine oxidase